MEKRVFVSKLDPTHRLRPIEAARENSRIKGHAFDEEEWKKLKPEEKAKQLTDSGYHVLENPEPRQPIDSTKLDLAFRGDRDIYTALDRNGLRKSHINEAGDLVPANAEGVFNGRDVNQQSISWLQSTRIQRTIARLQVLAPMELSGNMVMAKALKSI
jgi:hypothetical protein